MAKTNENGSELAELLAQIDALAGKSKKAKPPVYDAISRVLAAPVRTTQLKSVRDSVDFKQFKQDVVDGLIRVDAGHRVLTLIDRLLTVAMAM